MYLFFVGRGIDYAICMEGSLKMKEVSYIHSEAYAAGKLKHGTIILLKAEYLLPIYIDELLQAGKAKFM